VDRYAPRSAVGGAGADRGGALVDPHDHAGETSAVTIIERDAVTALEPARAGGHNDRLQRGLVCRLRCATLGVAPDRHVGDLPDSLGAMLSIVACVSIIAMILPRLI
jgi:hypothetical protein